MSPEKIVRPLDAFPAFRSRDINETRQALSSFGARYFDVASRAEDLHSRVNHWQSKNIDLLYCSYGAQVRVDFSGTNAFRQQICLGGAGLTRISRVERQITSAESCVVAPDIPMDVTFGPGYEHLVLKIGAQSLANKIAAMIGAIPARALEFDQNLGIDGAMVARLRRMATFFTAELDECGIQAPSPAIAELEQALIVSFICNNRHNYSAILESNVRRAAAWQVRRAEEYIEAHWDQPTNIEDLVRVTSASARSLFREFKRSRGYSPMSFVKEIRLRRAKEMLDSGGNRSVTETAYACGFSNLGHFARDYLKRFGERPSDTIRRVK